MKRKGTKESAADKAKAVGLPSLDYVALKTGMARSTLDRWHNDQPALYDIVLHGCLVLYDKKYREIVNILKG